MAISVYDVFTPARFPHFTYVTRQTDYEADVQFCIESGIIAFIHGATKSGKSVLAESAVRQLEGQWHKFSARNFKSSDEFWQGIASQLGLEESITTSQTQSTGSKKSVTWLAKISAWFAAEASIAGNIEKQSGTSTTSSQSFSVDPRSQLSKQRKRVTLIIDNFHYISDRNVQKEVLQELRNLLEHISLIIIAITSNPDYLNVIEPELIGRCKAITIRNWTNQELIEIAQKGFESLNVDVSDLLKQQLCLECFGAPAIMQGVGLRLMLTLGIKTSLEKKRSIGQYDVQPILAKIFKDTAQLFNMSQPYEQLLGLAVGNKSQGYLVTLRAQPKRNIVNDVQVTAYEATLQSLVSEQGVNVTLPELIQVYKNKTIIRREPLPPFEQILDDLHNASELLWQAETTLPLQSTTNANTPIEIGLLRWDKSAERVSLQDPYFAFFCRWSGHLIGAFRKNV